jgi:hypothetical protein
MVSTNNTNQIMKVKLKHEFDMILLEIRGDAWQSPRLWS